MAGPDTARPSLRQRWAWRLLVLEALVTLSVMALALRLLPFRHVARLFVGRPMAPASGKPPVDLEPASGTPPVWRVGQAVTRAAGLLPFPPVCLPQAIAAKTMLARRGHATSLHLSVRLGRESEPAAHAWLTWNGRAIIGGGLPKDQAEIARFL